MPDIHSYVKPTSNQSNQSNPCSIIIDIIDIQKSGDPSPLGLADFAARVFSQLPAERKRWNGELFRDAQGRESC